MGGMEQDSAQQGTGIAPTRRGVYIAAAGSECMKKIWRIWYGRLKWRAKGVAERGTWGGGIGDMCRLAAHPWVRVRSTGTLSNHCAY